MKHGQAVMSRKAMKARAAEIHEEWYRRDRAEKSRRDSGEKLPPKERVPPYDAAPGYLKRAVYEFVMDPAVSADGHERLKAIVQSERNAVSRPGYIGENPFFWGFSLVFGHDDKFPRADRSKFAEQLLYASKHQVPARFLVGFLYQIGGHPRVLKQRSGGTVEGWEVAPRT